MIELPAKPRVQATIPIPGSKSLSHRCLIAAALANGKSRITNLLICEDTKATLQGLQALGVPIAIHRDAVSVSGLGGRFSEQRGPTEIFLGNSGTSMRLLLSVAALSGARVCLTGTRRMHSRPIGPLVSALNALGARISCLKENGCPPVTVFPTALSGGRAVLEGGISSQFLSSLLLAAPCTPGGIEIHLTGKPVSLPYVDLTLDVMERFGCRVERDGAVRFRAPGDQAYHGREFQVEGDASSASYFWALAAVTGGTIVTRHVCPLQTRQGDIRFLDVLERMGCRIERKPGKVEVRGGCLKGVDVDMGAMPDMVPTLAAVALFARGSTAIKNVSHLRYKESDRLQSISREWRRIGAVVEELPDGLVIHGPAECVPALVDPHNDHRIAMGLAVVGARFPGIRLRDEGCVAKSFPRFWSLWNAV